jgi:hypothetical protein
MNSPLVFKLRELVSPDIQVDICFRWLLPVVPPAPKYFNRLFVDFNPFTTDKLYHRYPKKHIIDYKYSVGHICFPRHSISKAMMIPRRQ